MRSAWRKRTNANQQHTNTPNTQHTKQQQVRTLVKRDLEAALARCDFLVSPAAPTPAYRVGEKSGDPLEMYKGDLMTVNLNLAGLPAVVVPCGLVDAPEGGGARLPVGLQLIGRMYGEAALLAAAHAFEATAGALEGAAPAKAAGAAAAAAAAARR